VREERAHTPPAACLPSVPRQCEVPAAARKFELPLSGFPPPGESRGGQVPPTPLARFVPARSAGTPRCRGSPRKRGFKALR
jgi:hypothetical protein